MAVLLSFCHVNQRQPDHRRPCRRLGIYTRRRIAVTRFESCRQHDSRNFLSSSHALDARRIPCS